MVWLLCVACCWLIDERFLSCVVCLLLLVVCCVMFMFVCCVLAMGR